MIQWERKKKINAEHGVTRVWCMETSVQCWMSLGGLEFQSRKHPSQANVKCCVLMCMDNIAAENCCVCTLEAEGFKMA